MSKPAVHILAALPANGARCRRVGVDVRRLMYRPILLPSRKAMKRFPERTDLYGDPLPRGR